MMEEKLYEILKKHRLPLKKREELMVDLLNLFSVSKKLCDCESSKYILNEVKQELMCKCGKRFNVC